MPSSALQSSAISLIGKKKEVRRRDYRETYRAHHVEIALSSGDGRNLNGGFAHLINRNVPPVFRHVYFAVIAHQPTKNHRLRTAFIAPGSWHLNIGKSAAGMPNSLL